MSQYNDGDAYHNSHFPLTKHKNIVSFYKRKVINMTTKRYLILMVIALSFI